MPRGPNEQLDLDLINALIFAPAGLDLEPFDDLELKTSPTPDRRVWKAGEHVAFAGLKSPRDDRLDNMLDGSDGELVGYVDISFRDKRVERTARHITKAAKQFRAVNPQRVLPNIMAIVSHADAADRLDLIHAITGRRDGNGEPWYMDSARRIEHDAAEVDLYFWVDAKERRVSARVFTASRPAHVPTLCDLLGLDIREIKGSIAA
jgi:hypothetical protein